MRETFARCAVAMGAGLALIVAQGCKKQAAPVAVQPVVSSSRPLVLPDFSVGHLPVEDVDPGATPKVDRTLLRRPQVQPLQVEPVQVEHADAGAAAVAEAQRQQDEDARLLQQQEAASEQQQEELDREIEQDQKTQQEMEAEPRIQDIPELPEQAPMEPIQPQ
jgi:hypothetical protein